MTRPSSPATKRDPEMMKEMWYSLSGLSRTSMMKWLLSFFSSGGPGVGETEGASVGDSVATVGALVGAGVGDAVGASVASISQSLPWNPVPVQSHAHVSYLPQKS
jgi:hypothetical protein